MSVHEKALDSIFGDLDDFESKKMFGEPKTIEPGKGMSITITMTPDESKGAEDVDEGADDDKGFENLPADHEPEMCKGGCVKHMAEGGMVPPPPMQEPESEEDMKLPPFLRKKKPFGK
jgi:hypothetical protein